ncbi:hypothetical protein, partial [Salmonella sp. s51884]|uniref:hypothetical protein n=1 Tax=Salmonella sp. s51884 TaxID=3159654 RepID=UPI0039816F54
SIRHPQFRGIKAWRAAREHQRQMMAQRSRERVEVADRSMYRGRSRVEVEEELSGHGGDYGHGGRKKQQLQRRSQ